MLNFPSWFSLADGSENCTDLISWTDIDGYPCDAYAGFDCIDGVPQEEPEYFKQYAEAGGPSALDACCVCGGNPGQIAKMRESNC